MRLRHIEVETDNSLMLQGTQSRQDQINRENQLVTAELGEKPENMGQMAGIMSGNKNVKGKEENQNSQTSCKTHQLASTKMSLVEKVVDNGSFPMKPKAKWRRWKNQARGAQDSRNSKAVLKNAKRANCEKIAFSPKNKKLKLSSPSTNSLSRVMEGSPSAKLKLSWEETTMDVAEARRKTGIDISAEAGI